MIMIATSGLLVCASAVMASDARAGQQEESIPTVVEFNRDIRPILYDNCLKCHGPDESKRKSELRLDTKSGLFEDRGGYSVVVPGNKEDSELILRIREPDPDDRMPPPKSGLKLSESDIALLEQWVEQGAPHERSWAYVPPKRRAVPQVNDTAWPVNDVDRFVLAILEEEGRGPSPDADLVSLVRRLHFDLTGLPPSVKVVNEFVKDSGQQAYEKLVDHLLASSQYAERMAMYWLDLVRYADTVGYHGDQDHNIWPYRDYVINAFKANMPFDQFTREQIAGDLLKRSTMQQKVATGYNRLLQTSHEAGVQEKEYLTIYAADRVRNLSAVWMAATVGCAQCHDHKFDPFTAKDFYSMSAFFADIDESTHLTQLIPSVLPVSRAPEIALFSSDQRAKVANLKKRSTGLNQRIELLKNKLKRPVELLARLEAEGESAESPDQEGGKNTRITRLREQIAKVRAQLELLEVDSQSLKKQVATLRKQAPRTMITAAIEPRVIRVLPRGDWLDDSGPVVQPAIPEFLGQLDTQGRRANRLDLAEWLVSGDGIGDLTARVFVNRLWYLFFGAGLAPVLDDFGGQGDVSSHPELLDYLALEFVDGGWDVRHMVKMIVMSHAYRQSSRSTASSRDIDPYNRLFGRQASVRLPAEMVRDNALAISGLLVEQLGGPSIKPYQPDGYYKHLAFPRRSYEHHDDQRQWRRGLYTHWQRQFLHPMLKAFDAPRREECTAQRPISNTPLAALVLLNDPTFVEAARAFATRIIVEGGDDTQERVAWAFCQATSRLPSDAEREMLSGLFEAHLAEYTADPEAARMLIAVGHQLVPVNIPPEQLAAWSSVARAILNLNETITRG